MIRVVIIDDEYYAREMLKDLIIQITPFELKGCFESVEEFLKSKIKNEVDVIFLDIEMPRINGIKAAKYLERYKVVFVTAYSEYAVNAFEVNALDYLTKPISEVRFIETMRRIEEVFRDKKLVKISVENNKEIVFLDFSDVYFFEYFEKRILVITDKGEFVLKHFKNLSKLEKELPSNFIRVHKSYIVNIDYVERFIKNLNSLQLKGGKIIPIGKTHIRDIRNVLKI
ncbi:LytTR family transcriptional regulator [Thermosipho melanesiensis]|uniref:Two component transcriptional regulator, LytTR family n=2 Tax=Thermosipho melanesiensis TaxID=46541 RepID=A6LJ90_THEM4|nr:LytTR family DNA-binding domain-containing protein [Thermosipho melanesiensis]ABR29991.1 two component transcriptional regulator, LytTR family [Thermosipho melanesiensis BI429]APT73195.1 LytTR family transcriptional regulator [Thermosipho melanesiensis]OOC38590.1 LytTR family transcriptional regulator [Thermosipho melanesiensis]OOC40394.1 LytTR family transcriptional regulator [Thermosipho melanesiensis]OOC40658.1 LytTR family transcriptional regulator [Thermosipho melanesiensis]